MLALDRVTRRTGVSLLEVVIALALLALGLMFILAIVPTGIRSIKRSEDLQAAIAYGNEVVEQCRRSIPPEGTTEFHVTLNGTDFKITRQIFKVDARLTDIVVTAWWSDTTPARVLATRVAGQPRKGSP